MADREHDIQARMWRTPDPSRRHRIERLNQRPPSAFYRLASNMRHEALEHEVRAKELRCLAEQVERLGDRRVRGPLA